MRNWFDFDTLNVLKHGLWSHGQGHSTANYSVSACRFRDRRERARFGSYEAETKQPINQFSAGTIHPMRSEWIALTYRHTLRASVRPKDWRSWRLWWWWRRNVGQPQVPLSHVHFCTFRVTFIRRLFAIFSNDSIKRSLLFHEIELSAQLAFYVASPIRKDREEFLRIRFLWNKIWGKIFFLDFLLLDFSINSNRSFHRSI